MGRAMCSPLELGNLTTAERTEGSYISRNASKHHLPRKSERVAAPEISPEVIREPERDAVSRIVIDSKLPAREAEALAYPGKGRSVPCMRGSIVPSKSTIETHIKHIYAKTGVHSKQELLDLIETY